MKTEQQEANYDFDVIASPTKKTRKSDSFEEEKIISDESKSEHALIKSIFNIILEDWMFSFGKELNESDYALLLDCITSLVRRSLPLKFFIPGFPCKSSNNEHKVLGNRVDFSEFLAIRSLLGTIRKLQSLYSNGVKVVILSDYHTFDQYIGVDEEAYNVYHDDLKMQVHEAGGDDVIELISLSAFPEFKDTAPSQISAKLRDDYGGKHALETFDDAIKEDPLLLEKYKQMKKFMQADQSHNLPGSPRATKTRNFIKEIVRGIMAQGVALDTFLKQQKTLTDYVRLSIHNHRPSTGKFAIDLFKGSVCSGGILRTPWHHVVMFDSMTGDFIIDHKASIIEKSVENSLLVTVTMNERPWFLLRLHLNEMATGEVMPDLKVSMVRGNCGMIIECKNDGKKTSQFESSVLREECLTSMIKEFGLVVLRGFKKFQNESEIVDFYSRRAKHGILEWKFGPIHKVTPKENMPGYVNSHEGIPIHFDLVAPPTYMRISQAKHSYKDFICREFLLYCKMIKSSDANGATTFVDARGAVLALPGSKIREWEQTKLSYETKLRHESDKELYFGGKKNIYEYALVMKCPWTGHNVLRWWQSWTEDEHPDSSQHNWSIIRASPIQQSAEEIEADIKAVALDKRFFFSHAYKDGDQAFVNNYTTLHGRNGFTNERELWRLQAVPPSDNLPEFYVNNRVLK